MTMPDEQTNPDYEDLDCEYENADYETLLRTLLHVLVDKADEEGLERMYAATRPPPAVRQRTCLHCSRPIENDSPAAAEHQATNSSAAQDAIKSIVTKKEKQKPPQLA
jgi:hypothetical protein